MHGARSRLGRLFLKAVNPTQALILVGVLLIVAVGAGLTLRWAQNRPRHDVRHEVVEPARLGATHLGDAATLLQFSTDMCARCPGVHRLLAGIADETPGVLHLDVDLTRRPDIASHFHVLQTPTTLVLDSRGAVQARIGGVPRRDVVELELRRLTKEGAHV